MPFGTTEILLLLRARDEASRTLAGLSGNMRKMGNAQRQAINDTMARGRALVGVGVAIGAVGAAGLAFYGDAIAKAVQYNQQTALTATQLDKVNASMADLKKVGRDVAAQIPVAFDEIQPALYDIFSSMDVNLAQSKTLLTSFSKSAVAGQVSLQDSARATIGIMNAFHLKVNQVSTVQDVMFQLVRKGVGTYSQFAETIGRVSPSAVKAGQSIQTMAGMMAFLTRNGLSAAMASSSAARALDAISNPKSQDNFKAMGMSLYNAKGQFKSMDQIVQMMSNHLKGMTGPQRAKALHSMFSGSGGTIQAMRFFNVATKQAGQLKALTTDMVRSKGAMAGAYDIMFKQPQTQVQLLKNNIDILRTEVGDMLMPAFVRTTKVVIALVRWFNNLSPTTKKIIVVIGLVVSVMLVLIGIMVAVAGVFLMVSAAIAAAGGAAVIGAFIAAAAEVVAIIIAIVVVLVLLWKYHKQIWAFIKAVWRDVANAVEAAWNKIKDVVVSVSNSVWNFIKKIWGDIVDFIVGVWDAVVAAVKPPLMAIWGVVSMVFGMIYKIISTYVKIWVAIISLYLGLMWTIWSGIFRLIWTVTSTTWKAIYIVVAAVVKLLFAIVYLTIGLMWEFLKFTWNAIVADARLAWNLWKIVVWNPVKQVWDLLKLILTNILSFMRAQWAALKSSTQAAWNLWKILVYNPLRWAVTQVLNGVRQILSYIENHWDWIKSTTKSAWNFIKNAIVQPFEDAYNGVVTWIDNIVSAIGGIANKIAAPIKAATDLLNKLNPLHRNSPSIVDKTKDGWSAMRRVTEAGVMSVARSAQITNGYNAAVSATHGPVGVASRVAPAAGMNKQVVGVQQMNVYTQEIDPVKHAADLGWAIAGKVG